MKIKLLGSAAAEGIPALFCSCSTCKKSRELGGKNIRKRSSALIDNKIIIDFTNDFLANIHDYNLDFSRIEHLFITHSHSDHFNYHDLENRLQWYTNADNPILNVYANEVCIKVAKDFFQNKYGVDKCFNFNIVTPFSNTIIDDYIITALPARHITDYKNEKALNYVIQHNGKTIFYGLDSGWYYDETWNQLEQIHFDCLILDCTGGFLDFTEVGNHMVLSENIRVIKRLYEKGCIDDNTKIISTHFSHHGGVIYDRDFEKFKEKGIILSYDGMEIEI